MRTSAAVTLTLQLIVSVLIFGQASSVSGQQTDRIPDDPRIGKRVIVTTHGAELRTPEATVWRAYLGEVFTVSLTNGEWLWISEKQGWLWEKHASLFDSAVQEADRVVRESPTPENHHLRGVVLQAHGRYDEALKSFDESLRLKPNVAGVLNNRGQTRYLKREFTAAIEDFDAAIAADPEHFVALNNRALAYIAVNSLDQAEKDLAEALRLNKEYPEALNNRGVVQQKRGLPDKAIADFTAALKIDPRYTDALGNRAFAYRRQGNFTLAVADLEQARKVAPLSHEPVNDLAWLYATAPNDSVRDGRKAVELAKQACAMTQYNSWNTLDTLAAAYAESGDAASAGQWITTAIEKVGAEEPDRAEIVARLKRHQEMILAGKAIRSETID